MKWLVFAASAALAAPTLRRDLPLASQEDYDEMHRAAELSSAAYLPCLGSAWGTTIDLHMNDLLTGTQGFIAHDDNLKRITVSMRGTSSLYDTLRDFDVFAYSNPQLSGVNFPPNVQIMRGVFTAWASVHDLVMDTVRDLHAQYPDYTLEATGHSLGGALTYLSHVALAQNFPDATVVSNAVAAFPIGNQVWSDWAGSIGKLRRANNKGDGVPNMWSNIYKHYGTEYYGPGTPEDTRVCSGISDPNCAAGDGWFTVDVQHAFNTGVAMILSGCGW